jgi:hypothetical protein
MSTAGFGDASDLHALRRAHPDDGLSVSVNSLAIYFDSHCGCFDSMTGR